MRIPWAAQTLIEQVQAEKPKAKAEPSSDPDGLGVARQIRFDKRTSKWLAPLLDYIEDERIEEYHVTDAGYLHVEFVSGVQADMRARFPLEQAERLMSYQPDPEKEPSSSDSELVEDGTTSEDEEA